MKKDMKNEIVEVLKHNSTKRLEQIREDFDDWDHIHALKRSSWFWGDNGNQQQRSRKESYYYRDSKVKIGAYTISYYSNVSMSRKNVYWDDGLTLEGSDENVSFADINYLWAAINAIIDDRKNRKVAKAS